MRHFLGVIVTPYAVCRFLVSHLIHILFCLGLFCVALAMFLFVVILSVYMLFVYFVFDLALKLL